MFKAVATYRTGDVEDGKKQLEQCASSIDAEIERYQSVAGMKAYISSLHFVQLAMYYMAYDVFGSFRTILQLDALTLIAPEITTPHKPMLLNAYARCHLLDGDQKEAKKLWQQIKELDAEYFKRQPDSDPLKKAFGE